MITQLHGQRPPFEIQDNVLYFHDWRHVTHGGPAYTDAHGQHHGIWAMDGHPPVAYRPQDVPWGLELVAQAPEKGQPLIRPGDSGLMYLFAGSIMHDEGIYRLWLEGWPTHDQQNIGHLNQLRYLESDDGFTWRTPELGLLPATGTGPNNIVMGRPLNERFTFHGACVFKDPAAPSSERYKAFWLGRISPADLQAYRAKWPDDIDPMAVLPGGDAWGPCGAVSPDGLRWTVLDEPLLVNHSDTHNVCEYDPVRQSYITYTRTWVMERRSIGRSETKDFRHFPRPEQVFWPSPSMKPSDLWYANGKTRMPGSLHYHVMFPMLWSLQDDRFEFHLATSPDNVLWNLVPGSPICTPGRPGDWDGGLVAPGLGLVNLGSDRTGMLVCGCSTPHKHPRTPPYGALAWATWPRDRLVALQAREQGQCATFPLNCSHHGGLSVNCRVRTSGLLQLEVVGPDGQVVPGRSFDDCDLITNDHLRRRVTWRGEQGLKVDDAKPLTLRIRLRCGELYAVYFES